MIFFVASITASSLILQKKEGDAVSLYCETIFDTNFDKKGNLSIPKDHHDTSSPDARSSVSLV